MENGLDKLTNSRRPKQPICTRDMHNRPPLPRDILRPTRLIPQHSADLSSTTQQRPLVIHIHDVVQTLDRVVDGAEIRTHDPRAIDGVVEAAVLG